MILFLPLTVSADSYKLENINDAIYLYFSDEWSAFEFNGNDNMRFMQSPFSVWDIDSLEFFFSAYLLNCGYDYSDDSVFRHEYFSTWHEAVDADVIVRDCSFIVDAIDDLVHFYYFGMQNFSMGISNRPVVAFSADFVSIFNSWVDLYFKVNGLEKNSGVLPLKSSSFDVEKWYDDTSLTCVFFSQVEFGEGTYSLLPQHVVFKPVHEHQNVDDYELNGLKDIWDSVISFIDIRALTSWLPDILSTPIVVYFGAFVVLCGVLILLKLKG